MGSNKARAYEERFMRVFDYVDAHLDEPLTVDSLSRVANFSKYHFHRQFSEFAGICVARYIQTIRLRRASYQLVFNEERRITQIALQAGFESPESFARAFKREFGQTPSQFRKAPAWKPWTERMRLPKRDPVEPMGVNIVYFEHTVVAVLEHRGAPECVNDSARRFIEWRKSSRLSPVIKSQTFGIVYDDPETTDPAQFRFDIGGSVTDPVPENPQGVVNKCIEAGRCAVVRHYGTTDRIGDSAYYLYRDWLPQSGEELRDFPMFFHYLKLIPETPEHELITDVYLPLK